MSPIAKAILWAGAAIVVTLAVLVHVLGPWLLGLYLAGLLAVVLGLRFAWWAFVPRRELPRNRIRYQRIRLYLRLHPGAGHATAWELHRHWGRLACRKTAKLGRLS